MQAFNLAGRSVYEDLNACYVPNTHSELIELYHLFLNLNIIRCYMLPTMRII